MQAEQILRAVAHVVFSAYNITMMHSVLRARKKNDRTYCSAFFTLFLVGSAVDLAFCAAMVVLIRLPNLLSLVDSFTAAISCRSYTVFTFVICLQPLYHTAVTVNRFSFFYFDRFHRYLWSRRPFALICLSLFGIAALVTSLPLLSECTYALQNGQIRGAPATDTAVLLAIAITMASVYGACSASSFILTVATAWRIIRLRKTTKFDGAQMVEARFFAHSAVMLVLEGAYTMQFASRLPLFSGSLVQKLFSNLFFLMFVDLYSVAGPVLLFALRSYASFFSKKVRKDYLSYYGVRRNEAVVYVSATGRVSSEDSGRLRQRLNNM